MPIHPALGAAILDALANASGWTLASELARPVTRAMRRLVSQGHVTESDVMTYNPRPSAGYFEVSGSTISNFLRSNPDGNVQNRKVRSRWEFAWTPTLDARRREAERREAAATDAAERVRLLDRTSWETPEVVVVLDDFPVARFYVASIEGFTAGLDANTALHLANTTADRLRKNIRLAHTTEV